MDIKIITDKTNKTYIDKDNLVYAQDSNILSIINTESKHNHNPVATCDVIKDIIISIISNKYDLNNTDKEIITIIYKHYFNKKYIAFNKEFNINYITTNCSRIYGKTKRLYQLAINRLINKGIIYIDKEGIVNIKDDYNFITKNLNDITHVVFTI